MRNAILTTVAALLLAAPVLAQTQNSNPQPPHGERITRRELSGSIERVDDQARAARNKLASKADAHAEQRELMDLAERVAEMQARIDRLEQREPAVEGRSHEPRI